MQANVQKYYLYNFFLNFQLWWPIWIIYLKEDRGLSQAQVTLIDIPVLAEHRAAADPGGGAGRPLGKATGADRLGVHIRRCDHAVWVWPLRSRCCWRRT